MPITVVTPTTGDPFGPGFRIEVSTDTIGPLPTDSYWQFELTAPANENLVAVCNVNVANHAVQTILVTGSPGTAQYTWGEPFSVGGVSGQLKVILDSPSTALHEEATVAITMDRQTGQVAELAEWIRTAGVGTGTGLTTEEHDALIITQAAVTADIGPGIGDLIQSIGQLIISPPLAVGSLSSPPYELEGDGEIPDIGDPLHSRFGLYWIATTIPAGLGHLHGQTEEYSNRLVQFRTLHVLDGVTLVTEVFDANWHGGLWSWDTPKPVSIEYSILPGVHLQVRWWQFP